MDARTLTAIFLMILIYIYFFQPKQPPQGAAGNQDSVAESTITPDKIPSESAKSKSAEIKSGALDLKTTTLSNDVVSLKLSLTGTIFDVTFKNYKDKKDSEDAKKISFDSSSGFNVQEILGADLSGQWALEASSESEIRLIKTSGGIVQKRRITLAPGAYSLAIEDSVENKSKKSEELRFRAKLHYLEPTVTEKKTFLDRLISPSMDYHESLVWHDHSLFREAFKKVEKEEKVGEISFGGFSEKYFFTGVYFKDFSSHSVVLDAHEDHRMGIQTYETLMRTLAPNESTTFSYAYYLGPKDIRNLETAQIEMREVVNYGSWLGPIARLLLAILHFFFNLTANYGVAIILLTFVVKAVLFPLQFKSSVSMRKVQLIQPKMKALQEKYKQDKQRLQVELMNLYRTEKVNPVGGCLPLLLQMPVFFALYRVFYMSIEFRHKPLGGWLQDLSAHDPYFITPVVMTAIMMLQMKLTPQAPHAEENDMVKVQKTMMKVMPLMFGVFSVFLPSGLNIYLLTNITLSVFQQIYINRHLSERFPLPALPANSAAR